MREPASSAGPAEKAREEMLATAPVIASRRCVPYPTTTSCSRAIARGSSRKSTTTGEPSARTTVAAREA